MTVPGLSFIGLDLPVNVNASSLSIRVIVVSTWLVSQKAQKWLFTMKILMFEALLLIIGLYGAAAGELKFS